MNKQPRTQTMTLIEVIKQCGARVCGGTEYQWSCYGPHARYMDFADVVGNEYAHVVHDTQTYTIYEFAMHVPGQEQAFVWRNPDHVNQYLSECKERNIVPDLAWDHVRYETVDENTIMQYAKDIGELYYDDLPVPENV